MFKGIRTKLQKDIKQNSTAQEDEKKIFLSWLMQSRRTSQLSYEKNGVKFITRLKSKTVLFSPSMLTISFNKKNWMKRIKNNSNIFQHFLGMLLRKAKKEKIVAKIVPLLLTLTQKFDTEKTKSSFGWQKNVNFFLKQQSISNSIFFVEKFNFSNLELTKGSDFSTFIGKILKTRLPTFSFRISKIEKKIQKYSRGRSGKYSLNWSYLLPQKRFKELLTWLKKNIKLQKGLTLFFKTKTTLNELIWSPCDSFLVQLQRFAHTFVFQKYRRSLANTFF